MVRAVCAGRPRVRVRVVVADVAGRAAARVRKHAWVDVPDRRTSGKPVIRSIFTASGPSNCELWQRLATHEFTGKDTRKTRALHHPDTAA
jgi:hypothetical protein